MAEWLPGAQGNRETVVKGANLRSQGERCPQAKVQCGGQSTAQGWMAAGRGDLRTPPHSTANYTVGTRDLHWGEYSAAWMWYIAALDTFNFHTGCRLFLKTGG